MEISWLGHSCVRIRSDDVTLITDPYDESLGPSMGRQRADIVTVSHEHPHHSHRDGIEGDPRVLQGPGEYEIGNFYITGVGTNRNEEESTVNTIFGIHAEGLTLWHLGDLNHAFSPRQIESLGHTDVLFAPAGGVCTISASEAAELVNLVGPKIVIPLHYRAEGVKVELEPLEAFLDDLGVAERVRQPRIDVTASSLPRDMRVVVLEKAI